MKPDRLKLSARLGATVDIPVRVETTTAFAPIASISKGAPARIVTQAAHGMLDGWRTQVVDAAGLTDLNDAPAMRVEVVDTTTIELPDISTLGYRAHTAGTGALKFRAPKDLTDYTIGRMDIKARVGGPVLAALNTTDGTLEIDAANGAVWIHATPTTFAESDSYAALTARQYVFDIELVTAAGDVLAICSADSVLTILPEVTTSE
ncbi:MAG: hypothetical protein KBE22_00210 [Candidatus Accumulibacter sp.]|nr:hypothetical protein [Accumulibacter sp.]